MICSFALTANAQVYTLFDNSFAQSTHLIEIREESNLNQRARSLRDGNYETSGGDRIDFYKWYSPAIPEFHVSLLTQLSRNFGILWGFGTGERADKYTINPSMRIGFVLQNQFRKNQSLTLVGDTYLGGEMNEHSCVADYGDIGGIREVNCRLAASVLTPEETLDYLEYGKRSSSIRISYKLTF